VLLGPRREQLFVHSTEVRVLGRVDEVFLCPVVHAVFGRLVSDALGGERVARRSTAASAITTAVTSSVTTITVTSSVTAITVTGTTSQCARSRRPRVFAGVAVSRYCPLLPIGGNHLAFQAKVCHQCTYIFLPLLTVKVPLSSWNPVPGASSSVVAPKPPRQITRDEGTPDATIKSRNARRTRTGRHFVTYSTATKPY